MNTSRMVIVTGLSGSGRSAALKAFEDMGYYCVDNLPLPLLPSFLEYASASREAFRSAAGIDVRERDFSGKFPPLYRELKASGGNLELLFLEASDQTLVVMRADGTPPISVTLALQFTSTKVFPIALGLVIGSLLTVVLPSRRSA